ncbi:tetratricopeptide repeat protein [Porphyrobacter sp. AAP82]|uniref:tetratricopeptide repeat protein n=1 Tax=Porphyrobacter sp. AAP82 TaxID=1248917 RepID=UPI0002FA1FC5|nr:tetratricopeptide repeat protein [Porphyrobacter sp. AAP82]
MIGTVAALCAGAAQAETLPVEGIYAAGTDAPSRARSIALAGFAGRGGERLAFAIDSALRGAVIEGRAWFQLTFAEPPRGTTYTYDRDADPAAYRGGADAVMRGIAEVSWRDREDGTKQVEECVARGDRGKCSEKKKVDIPCRAREVTFRPEVRLVSHGGELLYGKGDQLTASRRFCKDEDGSPPVDSMVEELARQFADAVRYDLAPVQRYETIRVLESREGMSKPDQATFKAALRLTKTDVAEACAVFADLRKTNPRSVTVLFNVGLCIERLGELDTAAQLYQEVLAISPRKLEPQEGLGRIASRQRAERQLSIRNGDAAR